jgi:hypothetical protein
MGLAVWYREVSDVSPLLWLVGDVWMSLLGVVVDGCSPLV